MDAKKLTHRSGSNFYYAFALLPREKRQALYVLYNLCRELDDVVDQSDSPMKASEALERWRREIDLTYQDRPTHPLTQALLPHLQRHPIPKEYVMDLIAGMEMDLQPRRYKTFDDLYLYCYRVASVVGLMSIEIFGYGNPATRQYAVDMGLALQITNILRDLKPDAALGRIYLPQEDLERFGYTEQDLLANRYTPAFVQLMRFQAQRARGYYEAAARSLPPEDRRALSAARAMGATYRRLLEKIEKADYRVFDGRISLSKTRKVWIAAKTWLGGII